jgi:hypothetical protein
LYHRANELNRHPQNIPPTAVKYRFFLAAHSTFVKMDHILGKKASHNKYKNIEITYSTLTNHNGIKLDINNKRNY